MIDEFESQEIRSSGELWTEICSSLPEGQAPENNADFKDSFQPETQVNGQSNGTTTGSPSAKWEPMEDSEVYIASLGITPFLLVHFLTSLCVASPRSCHSLLQTLYSSVEDGRKIKKPNSSTTAV